MIKINFKKILIVSFLILFITSILVVTSFGMTYYQNVDFSTGLVTATTLNVRQGPGNGFKVVTQVYKNQYIRVFAKIGDWYVIQTEGDYVGLVSSKYIKPIYPSNNTNTNTGSSTGTNQGTTTTTSDLSADEKEVFDLVNKQRIQAGLKALVIDKEVQKIARLKAQDMVNKNYFSHTSPTYGSPFDMMKSFGITYKSAGENIAGNSSNSAAVTAWMNSEGHRANILNSSYNYTGVGAVTGSQYGKIFVQMFIGR